MSVPARAGSAPLRVGVLLDGFTQPRWIELAIEQLLADGCATLNAVVLNGTPSEHISRMQAWYRNRQKLLFAAYDRFDNNRYGAVDDALQPRNIERLFAGVPTMTVTPRATKFSDYFPEPDIARLRELDLDVVLRFGFRILRGEILELPRFGVWSYHHGDNNEYRGGPAGFWEVMRDDPVTGCVLQVLSEDLDGGRVLYRSYGGTEQLSVRKNKACLYLKSSAFVARAARRLHETGSLETVGPVRERCAPATYSRPIFTVPDNRVMLGLLARLAGRYVRQRVRGFTHAEQWMLAYGLRSGRSDDGPVPDLVPYRFKPLLPPRDRFWADPFPVTVDGRHYVFLEEFLESRGRGHISVLEVGKQGPVGDPVPVIEREHHLAYPFIFEWEGTWYLIPESIGTRSVELYRAVEFPFRWEFDRVLLGDVVAVDPTFAHIDGRWWMFANGDAGGASTMDELNIFHADSLFGPWTAHPRNPVISDVRRSRPAGRLFRFAGAWCRPSQDSAGAYGRGIVINRILRLDGDTYEETPVARVSPEWMPGLTGTHTINAAEGITVIDARLRRRRFP